MEGNTRITNCYFSALLVLSPTCTILLLLDELWRLKRVKNSHKMHVAFFVHYGLFTVNIDIPPAQFSIHKGNIAAFHLPCCLDF